MRFTRPRIFLALATTTFFWTVVPFAWVVVGGLVANWGPWPGNWQATFYTPYARRLFAELTGCGVAGIVASLAVLFAEPSKHGGGQRNR